MRDAIRQRDAGLPCPVCGQPILPGEAVHIDHVLALANGGTNDERNLRATHASCNLRKGAK